MYSYNKNGRKAPQIQCWFFCSSPYIYIYIYICIYLFIYKYELHHLKTRLRASVTALRIWQFKIWMHNQLIITCMWSSQLRLWKCDLKKLNLWSWQRSQMLHKNVLYLLRQNIKTVFIPGFHSARFSFQVFVQPGFHSRVSFGQVFIRPGFHSHVFAFISFRSPCSSILGHPSSQLYFLTMAI